MKKITVLACALAFSLGFVGCSSDDSGSGVSEEKLAGKWAYETYKVTAGGQTVLPEEDYSENQAGCAKDFIQLNADNTGAFGDYWSSECDLSTYPTTWSLDGKTVTVMEDGVGTEYKVTKLSDTKMTIEYSEEFQGMTWKETYTFTKASN